MIGLSGTAAAQIQPTNLDRHGASGPGLDNAVIGSVVGFVAPTAVGTAMLLAGEGEVQGTGAALFLAGILIGPSVGSFMLDDTGRALWGTLIRTGAGTAFVGSGIWRFSAGWGEHETGVFLSNAAIALSLGTLVYGIGYNFATLHRSAEGARVQAGMGWDATANRPMPAFIIQF